VPPAARKTARDILPLVMPFPPRKKKHSCPTLGGDFDLPLGNILPPSFRHRADFRQLIRASAALWGPGPITIAICPTTKSRRRAPRKKLAVSHLNAHRQAPAFAGGRGLKGISPCPPRRRDPHRRAVAEGNLLMLPRGSA